MISFKTIILLFTFCSYVHLIPLDIIPSTEKQTFNVTTMTIQFTVKNVNFGDNNNYLKITTVPTTDSIPANMYISKLYSYVTRKNAVLLSSGDGNNVVYLLKDEVDSQDYFYLTVNCPKNCSFDIYFEYMDNIRMKKGESYSYLVRSDPFTQKTTFYILRDEKNDNITISASGGNEKDCEMTVSYNGEALPDQPALYNGDIITINEENLPQVSEDKNYYVVNVLADKNVYVTVSSRIISTVNVIYPNEKAVSGYVDTNIIEKECFNFEPSIIGHTADYEVSILAKSTPMQVYFETEEGVEVPEMGTYEVTAQLSFIFPSIKESGKLICLRPLGDAKAGSFTLQITDLTNLSKTYATNQPLVNGVPYRHFLDVGKIAYYRHTGFDKTRRETNYNLKVIKGDPIMYIHRCDTFPECFYTEDRLRVIYDELKKPHDVNGFFTYAVTKEQEENEISYSQNLLIVKCGDKLTANEQCEFEITFTDNNNYMFLRPDSRFSQYIMPGETDLYKFVISDSSIKKILVNLFTFTGDSFLNITTPKNIKEKKYYVGNKEIFEYTIDESQSGNSLLGEYELNVQSSTNSYYSVFYIPIREASEKIVNLPNQAQFLEAIKFKEEKTKTFIFEHKYKKLQNPFVASFLSYNCRISVSRNGVTIPMIDEDFYEEELTKNDPEFDEDQFKYEVTVEEMDSTVNYEDEMCMVYMTSHSNTTDLTEIVLSEGTPSMISLTQNVPKITYLYPHAINGGDVIANMILEDDAIVRVRVFIENNVYQTEQFSRNRQVIIRSENINSACNSQNVCNIILVIELEEDLNKQQGTKLEILIRPKESIPSFLKKQMLREEATPEMVPNYFMSEISKGEIGEVAFHFNRGSANIYARIVGKEVIEDNPDFNGKYKYPKENSPDLIPYDPFTRKLLYTEEKTNKCEKGCDIIIAVVGSDSYHHRDEFTNTLLDYSVFIRPLNNIKGKPIVDIPANEFIIGHLPKTILHDYYEYYTFYVPNDSDNIIIELQSEVCNVYVNLGTETPNMDKAKWKFTSNGHNQLLKIPKSETGLESLKNQVFTIAVGANALDEGDTGKYVLRMRAPKVNTPEVVEINADQPSLCEVKEENGYCDFIVSFDDFDSLNILLIHAFSSDIETKLIIYTKLVNTIEFNMADAEKLSKILPRKGNSKASTENSFNTAYMIDYEVFTEQKYLLVSVSSSKKTIVNLLTTFKISFQSTVPNPNGLHFMNLFENEPLNLVLPNNHDYMVYITSIEGIGTVGFEGESTKTSLKAGSETLAISTNGHTNKTLRLENTPNELQYFIFYVEYKIRPKDQNFDEITYGYHGDVKYEGTDFPLVFYTKATETSETIVTSINLKSLTKEKEESIVSVLDEKFSITGYVVNQTEIIRKKTDKDYKPSTKAIEGSYDIIGRTAKVKFTPESFKTNGEEKYMYIEVQKGEKNNAKYTGIQAEVSSMPDNNNRIPSPINQYNYGFIENNQTKPNLYLLRTERESYKKMRIEFSSSSNELTYALLDYSEEPVELYKNSTNITISKEEVRYGKSIIDIDLKDQQYTLLLSVFPANTEHKVTENMNSNYVFKYKTSKNEPVQGTIANVTIPYEYNEKTKELKLSINSVLDSKGNVEDATYYVRIIKEQNPNNTLNFNSISFGGFNYQYTYAKSNITDKIFDFIIFNFEKEDGYYYSILVNAVTKSAPEIYAYDAIVLQFEKKGLPGWAIFLIVLFCLLVLVGIFFLFRYFSTKKTNLENTVEKTSFVGDQNKNLLTKEEVV